MHAIWDPERTANLPENMEVTSETVNSQFALGYLHDVVIFFKTPERHIRHIREVLTLLMTPGVTLELKNCQLFTETIDYLGHSIRPRRLEIASHRTYALRGLQDLTINTGSDFF